MPTSHEVQPKALGKNNKKAWLSGLLAIIIIVAGWAVLSSTSHIGQKVYAQAAGHKIYKSDVDNLINGAKGISEHQAAAALADKYLLQSLAKKQGVTISTQDIQAAFGPKVNLKKQQASHKYSYQQVVNGVYLAKIQSHYRGIYKGEVLVTHFSRYIAVQPQTAADKAAFPKLGDPAAIAQDKKYAQDLINSLYSQIKSGKMTWDQAIQTEHNDPVVGEGPYPSSTHSGPFDTSKGQEPLFVAPSAQQKVNTIKAGQTSKPFAVSVKNVATGKYFDSYFLVVKMDSVSGGGNGTTDFSQYLNHAEQQEGYKIYV